MLSRLLASWFMWVVYREYGDCPEMILPRSAGAIVDRLVAEAVALGYYDPDRSHRAGRARSSFRRTGAAPVPGVSQVPRQS
jgi:hypothetical protein